MKNPQKIPKRARELLIRASSCSLPDEAIVWISEALVTGVIPVHKPPIMAYPQGVPASPNGLAVFWILTDLEQLYYLTTPLRFKHPWKTRAANNRLHDFENSLNLYERQTLAPPISAPTP